MTEDKVTTHPNFQSPRAKLAGIQTAHMSKQESLSVLNILINLEISMQSLAHSFNRICGEFHTLARSAHTFTYTAVQIAGFAMAFGEVALQADNNQKALRALINHLTNTPFPEPENTPPEAA